MEADRTLQAMMSGRTPSQRWPVNPEHIQKPSISSSSVYSCDTLGSHGSRHSWADALDRSESVTSIILEDADADFEPTSALPGIDSNLDNQFALEDILKTPRLQSNSISSSGASPGRPELWRRRSEKSDRSVNITDLRLAQSNGFTVNQPLRKSLTQAPAIPLPPVPRQTSAQFTGESLANPTQLTTENLRSNTQYQQPPANPRFYSQSPTEYSQLPAGPAPFVQPTNQYPSRSPPPYQSGKESGKEQTSSFPTRQSSRKPVPLQPAPPQPDTMGGRLSKMKNKFRSTEQLYQPPSENVAEVPEVPQKPTTDALASKLSSLRNRFRSSDEDDVSRSAPDLKGSGSAFSKIKHKLRSSDADDSASPDLSSPEGSGWKLSKLKSKLRSSSGNADDTPPAAAPSQSQPSIARLPTPDYQKQDPIPTPVTPQLHSPYSPQISPKDPPPGPASRPGSRGRDTSGSSSGQLPQSRIFDNSQPRSRSKTFDSPSRPQSRNRSGTDVRLTPTALELSQIHPLLRRENTSSSETLTITSATPLRSPQPRHPDAPNILIQSGAATRSPSASPTTATFPQRGVPPPNGMEKFKLQVPGEISKRMSTILESSPFLHTPATDKVRRKQMPKASGEKTGVEDAEEEMEAEADETVYRAPALDLTQLQCYQGHKQMRPSRNDVYALACSVCGVQDRGKRWCCAWCAVRCCQGCYGKLRTTEGGLAGVLVGVGKGSVVVDILSKKEKEEKQSTVQVREIEGQDEQT